MKELIMADTSHKSITVFLRVGGSDRIVSGSNSTGGVSNKEYYLKIFSTIKLSSSFYFSSSLSVLFP